MELSKDLFTHIPKSQEESELIARPSITFWQDVWRRFKKNPAAMFALCLLVALTVMVIIGPYLRGFSYNKIDGKLKDITPNATYWFGTDTAGRDIFTRVWMAGRTSLAIGLVSAVLVTVVGILYGCVSGFVGGTTDTVMMRIIEILSALPYLLIVILLQIRLKDRSLRTLLLALVITGWTGTARLVRGEVLKVKSQEFVLAARTLGSWFYLCGIVFVLHGYRACTACDFVGHYVLGSSVEHYVLSVSTVFSIADDCVGYVEFYPFG